MSAALINRSLTNTRTELEFLLDSEVITKDLYDLLMASLPAKYQKDMDPWDTDKVPTKGASQTSTDSITSAMASTQIADRKTPAKTADAPLPARPAPVLGYCKATYDYESSEDGDLKLDKGVRIAVLEHLSADWWKGYKQGEDASKAGVFPANYVSVISQTEFETSPSEKATLNEKSRPEVAAPPSYNHEYTPPSGVPPQGYQPPADYGSQQPSYGGYAQFPPPSTNYYPPQQQMQQQPQGQMQQQPQGQMQQQPQGQMQQQPQGQMQQQQQSNDEHHHSRMNGHVKSIGSKFGNAAIFGAGSTLGSDIMRSIF